ncbi:MAG: acyl--CoA ligase [Candidatus Marinimicrobia bacterium]|nr:acyl--CoA ligase [Candidatus Neomarinimicrobiota bacterium]
MNNLTEFIYHSAENTPDKPFIIHGDYKISFQKAASQISSISRELQNAGVKSGQTVGILLQNCPEFVLTYLAVLNTGALASLLPWTMPEDEVATLATTTRVDSLIYSVEFQSYADHIRNLSAHPIRFFIHGRETGNDAVNIYDLIRDSDSKELLKNYNTRNNAVVLFSAGDFTHPKSLVFTHESIITTALSVSERFHKNYQFRIYTSLPYFHYFPFSLVINLAIVTGNTIVIPFDSSRSELYKSIQKHGVNIFVSNSGFIKELISEKYLEPKKLKSIDFYIPVGGSFSIDVKNIIFRRYNAQVIEAYGVAEAPVIAMNFNDRFINTASVGKPLSCCKVKILDDRGNPLGANEPGYLYVKGKNTFDHYIDRYSPTDEWIDTGDVARQDDEGYLYWICKKSDWFYRYGFRVDPNQIISVAKKYNGISEATVFSSKQNHWHDLLTLIVTLDNENELDVNKFMSYLKEYLPKYTVPEKIKVIDHFDRNCVGIIKKSHITFDEH